MGLFLYYIIGLNWLWLIWWFFFCTFTWRSCYGVHSHCAFFQNAPNEQCSMCGPAVETHTVHPPVGYGLISLIQQVRHWILIQTCGDFLSDLTNFFSTFLNIWWCSWTRKLTSLFTVWHRKQNCAVSFVTPFWPCGHIKLDTILGACCYT